MRLSYLPLVTVAPATTPIVSLQGRYGIPRRGEWPFPEMSLEFALVFGLPGSWTTIDPTTIDIWAESGELTFPVNALGLFFNEVDVVYNAGLATIPAAVKVACAQIVKNAQATPALNVKSGQIDRMRLDYFGGHAGGRDGAQSVWSRMWRGRARRAEVIGQRSQERGRMRHATRGGGIMGGGICGSALVRAADALLKALGGDTVSLLLPATAMASDAAGQLGLVDPGVQEVLISPVVTRALVTGNLGPRRRIEFTLSASAIADQLPRLGMGTAEDLFNAVLGLEVWRRCVSHRDRWCRRTLRGRLTSTW